MIDRVLFRHEAELDLEAAHKWYEQQQMGLGSSFLNEIERTLHSIAMRPLLHPPVKGQARRALTRRFPYSIFYVVRPECIMVIGVLHHHRDPKLWQRRVDESNEN